MTEREMVDITLEKLQKLNIPACKEVGFLSRSIDLVVSFNTDCLTVVEFKRKDWKGAVRQVKTHFLGADRVYICLLPMRTVPEQMKNQLASHQIGLYFFNEDLDFPLEEQLAAGRSRLTKPTYKAWLRKAFYERMKP